MRSASGSQIEQPGRASSRVGLGRVLRARGLDGGLLVAVHGDDASTLRAAFEVTLEGDPGEIPFWVRRLEPAGRTGEGHERVCLWLEGLTDRERAERWTGAAVVVAESDLPELAEGEFYWREVIGARCRLADGKALGVVEEIWPTGAHDVLVVRQGASTRLIPATDEVLVRLDRAAGELWIDPPEGMLLSDDAEPQEA